VRYFAANIHQNLPGNTNCYLMLSAGNAAVQHCWRDEVEFNCAEDQFTTPTSSPIKAHAGHTPAGLATFSAVLPRTEPRYPAIAKRKMSEAPPHAPTSRVETEGYVGAASAGCSNNDSASGDVGWLECPGTPDWGWRGEQTLAALAHTQVHI
jgi:hypothetical protein